MKVEKAIYLILGFLFFPAVRGTSYHVYGIDTVVAVVEGEAIAFSEAVASAKVLEEVRGKSLTLKEAVEYLVKMHVLRKEAGKRGLKVEDDDVTSAIKAIAEKNGLRYSELKKMVEERGIPFDIYREVVRFEILRQEYVRSFIQPRIMVSRADVLEMFRSLKGEELRALNLILFTGKEEKKVRKLRRWLIEGRLNVEDALRGAFEGAGALKIEGVLLSELHPAIEEAVKNLEPGAFSEVVKIGDKWSFVYLQGYGEKTLTEDLYKKLEFQVFLKKVKEELERELESALRNYYVEYKKIASCQEEIDHAEVCLQQLFNDTKN